MKIPYCIIADFESYNEEFEQMKDWSKRLDKIEVAEQNPLGCRF